MSKLSFFNRQKLSEFGGSLKNTLRSKSQILFSEQTLNKVQTFIVEGGLNTIALTSTLLLMSYSLAGTLLLLIEDYIPEPPRPPSIRISQKIEKRKSASEYAAILNRNLFSSKNFIPENSDLATSGPAKKSSLPLNLVGTIVLADELKSIATIEDRSQNLVFPVRIDETIDNKVRITKIEKLRVYFINKSTGHLEYIEIIEDIPSIQPQVLRAPTPLKVSKKSEKGVTQISEGQFDIDRSILDQHLARLREILQQARAVPNYENGVPEGYRLTQIQPGSIFESLGLKDNDVLVGINDEMVNDPGKAFQLFNELKTANHINIKVKRGGRVTNLNYDIR